MSLTRSPTHRGTIAACLLFGLAAASSATSAPPSAKLSIKPSDIDKSLAEFDENNPFLTVKYKVEFEKTAIKKYDAFLTEAAALKGAVVVTTVVLEDLERVMMELAGSPAGPVKDYDKLGNAIANNRGRFKPDLVAHVQRDAVMLDSLVGVMKDLPARVQKLSKKATVLASAATKDLMKNPFGMLAVPGALADAVAQVSAAAADAPATVARSANVIKVLAVCGCSYGSTSLTPADISPALAPLYAANPFETTESRVEYIVTGFDDFDAFFKDVAVLRGSTMLIDVLTRDAGATVAGIASAGPPTTPAEFSQMATSLVSNKTKPVGDNVMKIKNHLAQATGIAEALLTAPARATDLIAKGQGLLAGAAQNAIKSPAKFAGLPLAFEDTTKVIVESATKATSALAPLTELTASMASLAEP